MRRLLIAGNWKMHMIREEGIGLVDGILAGIDQVPANRDLMVFPPYTLLHPLSDRLRGSRCWLGAQDLHWEPAGAYTSGISAAMIRDAGCTTVLVGHSERRDHFGDTGSILARKLRAALEGGLSPIYCVGEHLEDREQGRTEEILRTQVAEVMGGLGVTEMGRTTLAYEPVWAIGTGRTATPEIAQEAHRYLRSLVADSHGAEAAGELRILYGGSVKPENAAHLLGQEDVDGALVGGASLKADGFLGIARAGVDA